MFKEFYCSSGEDKDFSYELFKYFFVPLILFTVTVSITGLGILIPVRTINYLYNDYKKSDKNIIQYINSSITLIFLSGLVFFLLIICLEYYAFDNLNNGFIKKFIDLILGIGIKLEKNYDKIYNYCYDHISNIIN